MNDAWPAFADAEADADRVEPPALLWTAAEAAKALRISRSALWRITAPQGPIRPVRVGRSLRYPPRELERWIAEQIDGDASPAPPPKVE